MICTCCAISGSSLSLTRKGHVFSSTAITLGVQRLKRQCLLAADPGFDLPAFGLQNAILGEKQLAFVQPTQLLLVEDRIQDSFFDEFHQLPSEFANEIIDDRRACLRRTLAL